MDTANRFLPKEEALVRALMPAKTSMETVGIYVSRYRLVLTLLLIGRPRKNLSPGSEHRNQKPRDPRGQLTRSLYTCSGRVWSARV
jgi:hypothetical protein